jgi:hypothetical protein
MQTVLTIGVIRCTFTPVTAKKNCKFHKLKFSKNSTLTKCKCWDVNYDWNIEQLKEYKCKNFNLKNK